MLQRVSSMNPVRHLTDEFRHAMRGYAGSVSVLAVQGEDGRTGCIATSVSSFSMTPPSLILGLAQGSSTARALRVGRPLGVSLLAPAQQDIAACFAGVTGVAGEQRFGRGEWRQADNGAWMLGDALSALACTVEELWPRHGHLIVLARVDAVQRRGSTPSAPLMYWSAAYRCADWH